MRVPGDLRPSVKNVADLKAWTPQVNVADVEVCGWVRSVRKSSGVRFVDVTDGSSMRPLQAVVDKKQSSECASGPLASLQHGLMMLPACDSAQPFA